jgi:drug/metabolite transporter (DMT)-like permease
MKQVLSLVMVMFLWAICFPLIVLGLPYAPHLTFATMRGFIAGIALLALALILGRPQPRDLNTWLILAAIGLGATTIGFYGMFHASEFVAPGIATVITNTQPLIAAILATLVLKERLDKYGKIGLWLGFAGIFFIAFPGLMATTGGAYGLGISYILLSAVGISISNVLIRKLAGRVDAMSAMGWQLIIGSMFLGLIALATEDVVAVTWNSQFVLALVGLALPGTALVYWLWCIILEQMELTRANVFSFLVPVFGLTMGVVFFQERMGLMSAFGIGLTLLGIFFVNRPVRLMKP